MTPVLLCLHGWGGSQESFTQLREALHGASLEILTPDLPGFGGEKEPQKAWTTDDYADWVADWAKAHIDPARLQAGIFLLGHSHGGRIAILLVHRLAMGKGKTFPISHLFLCAAAGIRHPRHFKRIIGLTLAKTGNFFLSIPGLRTLQPLGKKLLYKLVRVHDYEQASPVMRQTMINVSAQDLRPLLHTITSPTDLFWGTDDHMTPFSDAKIMEQEIKQSHLHVFPGIRHRVHRDKAKEIAEVIKNTIRKH